MQSVDSFVALADMVPATTIPLYGLRLVSVTDGDERALQVCLHGAPDVETVLGALDIVRDLIVRSFVGDE